MQKLYILYAVSLNTVGSKQQETVSLLTVSITSFSGSHCKQISGWWASLLPLLSMSSVLWPLHKSTQTTIKLISSLSEHQKSSSDSLAKALPWRPLLALERTAEDGKLLLTKKKFKYYVSVCLHSRPETAAEWWGTNAKLHTCILLKHLPNHFMTPCKDLYSTLITKKITYRVLLVTKTRFIFDLQCFNSQLTGKTFWTNSAHLPLVNMLGEHTGIYALMKTKNQYQEILRVKNRK